MIGHKEERFMIPILGTFLILLVPLAAYLLAQEKGRWRIKYFYALNLFLLFFASTNIPQRNVIGVVQYLGDRPHIKAIYSIENSLILFPSAYMKHSIEVKGASAANLPTAAELGCNDVMAIRPHVRSSVSNFLKDYVLLGEFHPGLLEGWIVKANPKRNARRGPIELYGAKGC